MKFFLLFLFFPLLLKAACTLPAGTAGELTYHSSVMKFCDGSNWQLTIANVGASCAGTLAGTLNYSAGDFRFCNGTNWYSMKGASLGSCAGTLAGTYNYNASKYRFCDGTNWYEMVSSLTAPTGLSLAHSSRNRTFTVTWTAGSGNGGAGGCKLQYYKDNATWTDLTGTYNCDSTTTAAAATFPNTSNWTNNFNGTGVQVRIMRISDSTAMGTFSQRGTCTTTSGSLSSTPNVDEDCNGVWNNTAAGSSTQNAAMTAKAPGDAFDCNTACSNIGGTSDSFAYFYTSSLEGLVQRFVTWDAPCTTSAGYYGSTAGVMSATGVAPSVTDCGLDVLSGACQTMSCNVSTFKVAPGFTWKEPTCQCTVPTTLYY